VHELPTPIAESALKWPEAREPQNDREVLTIAMQMEGRTYSLSPCDPEFKIKTMSLRNELENSGSWLFRHRSYLPLLIVPIFLVGLSSFTYLSQSHAINEAWQFLCLLVSFLGLAVRIITVGRAPIGTSGRNTREQVANTLNTTGVYSVVRHPLYLGNYLIMIGFAMWPHIWWMVVLISCIYALYYERIMLAEEAFLRQRFGETFEKWSAQTPAFIPKFRGWNPSPVPFCWRTVAQREYNAFFLIIAVFFLFDSIGDSIVERRWHISWVWFGVFVAGFLIFAVLRSLKKRTSLLNVEGR
jgi:protein-S-isoprenylcysteine O-methyltransferase Ste14